MQRVDRLSKDEQAQDVHVKVYALYELGVMLSDEPQVRRPKLKLRCMS